jgi:ribosomal protein S13
MPIEDRIKEQQFKNTTGSALRFTAIEGVGEKTARKVKQVRGVNAPRDVKDYSTSELASAAGISENRARKIVRGSGGNPKVSNTGTPSSIGAGNIAEGLDQNIQENARTVQSLGPDRVESGLLAGAVNVDRQSGISMSKKADQSDITDLPDKDLLELGQIADSFSEATKDPFDPSESAPISADEDTRNKVAKPRLAARRELGERGFERDEISSEFSKKPSGEFQSGLLSGFFGADQDVIDNYDIDREEYGRAQDFQQDRSAKSMRVDSRRKAPVTDEITKWKNNPSHWDYPGMDRPQDSSDNLFEF